MSEIPQSYIDAYARYFMILAKIERRLKLEELQRKREAKEAEKIELQ